MLLHLRFPSVYHLVIGQRLAGLCTALHSVLYLYAALHSLLCRCTALRSLVMIYIYAALFYAWFIVYCKLKLLYLSNAVFNHMCIYCMWIVRIVNVPAIVFFYVSNVHYSFFPRLYASKLFILWELTITVGETLLRLESTWEWEERTSPGMRW